MQDHIVNRLRYHDYTPPINIDPGLNPIAINIEKDAFQKWVETSQINLHLQKLDTGYRCHENDNWSTFINFLVINCDHIQRTLLFQSNIRSLIYVDKLEEIFSLYCDGLKETAIVDISKTTDYEFNEQLEIIDILERVERVENVLDYLRLARTKALANNVTLLRNLVKRFNV